MTDYYKETVYSPLNVRILYAVITYLLILILFPVLLSMFYVHSKGICLMSLSKLQDLIVIFWKKNYILSLLMLFPPTLVFLGMRTSILINYDKLILNKSRYSVYSIDINKIESAAVKPYNSKALKEAKKAGKETVVLYGFRGSGIEIKYKRYKSNINNLKRLFSDGNEQFDEFEKTLFFPVKNSEHILNFLKI